MRGKASKGAQYHAQPSPCDIKIVKNWIFTWTKAVVWKAVNSKKNPPPRRRTFIQFSFVIWKDSIVEATSSSWSFNSSELAAVNDPLRTDESLSWTEDSCLKDCTADASTRASTSIFALRLVSSSLLIFVQAFPMECNRWSLRTSISSMLACY